MGVTAGYDAEAMLGGLGLLECEIPTTFSGMSSYIQENFRALFGGSEEDADSVLHKGYIDFFEHLYE